MKKFMAMLVVVIALLTIVACGGGKKDERTLQDIIKIYEENGAEIDSEQKPLYELINASDAVIFYIDDKVVKIYEYASEKELEQAKKEFSDMMADWPTNGKFLLETSNEDASNIFNGIE